MHHLVFGINFQIHFVNLTSLVSIYFLSTHLCHHPHSHHPSLLHSFTPGYLSFQQILPTLIDFFYLLDCLYDNGTITFISLFLVFSFYFFCLFRVVD